MSSRSSAEAAIDRVDRLPSGLVVTGADGVPTRQEHFLGVATRTLTRKDPCSSIIERVGLEEYSASRARGVGKILCR
jgi:hypothetical protein